MICYGITHISVRSPGSYYGTYYYTNRCLCVGFALEIADPKNNGVEELKTHLGQTIPIL